MDSTNENGGHNGYELRENPKKSWKFSSVSRAASDSAPALASIQESQCKVCGKDFESLKALYGHMRHHPRKDRKMIQCKECGKALLSAKSLCNHRRVHSQKSRVCNESEAAKELVVKRKRSERKRYKSKASSSNSSLNESLSVTEIDQEVVQGAECLMMLSKGVRDWGGFSDNDSVTLEVKSLNNKKKKKSVFTNGGKCFVSNGNTNRCLMKKPRLEKLDSIVLYDKEEGKCNEMDSGAETDEGKKVKLEVSLEKLYEDGEFEKMPLPRARVDESLELVSTSVSEIEKESGEESMMAGKGGLNNEAEKGIKTSTSSKKVGFNAELGGDIKSDDNGILDDSQKKTEIKCETCNKVFCSHRALGVHQRIHSTKRSSIPVKFKKQIQTATMFPEVEVEDRSKLGCIESSREKENKEYRCRICLKVFATGQALGGHQRTHRGRNSDTSLQEIVVEQDYSDVSKDLDHDALKMLKVEVGDAGAGSEPRMFVESEPHSTSMMSHWTTE